MKGREYQRCEWCNEVLRFMASRNKRKICRICRGAMEVMDIKMLKERLKNE